MKIKKIDFNNHPILGDIKLDFTIGESCIADTVIIAGENGTGKSTILNAIYDFSNFSHNASENEEMRIFKVEFSEKEIDLLIENIVSQLNKEDLDRYEATFQFSYPWKSWNEISASFKMKDGSDHVVPSHLFVNEKIKPIFSSVFSDVEINFNSNEIVSTTSMEVDAIRKNSKRTSAGLATEITQMLVDIHSLDAIDYLDYANKNIGKTIKGEDFDNRLTRFKEAFSYIFQSKKYKSVKNINGKKVVVFDDDGKDIPLQALSSGEKQIVFRGSFLLRDQKNIDGALVLIDEPEISLHPSWQLKIVDYYKRLFTSPQGEQTSQIFIVTHSPFVIHNKERVNDKIVILKKDLQGKPFLSLTPEFYGWDPEKIVKEAFDLSVDLRRDKTLVITEGKTDWKHLKSALEKLKEKEKYSDLDFDFFEYQDDKVINGDSGLQKLCEHAAKLPRKSPVIFIFDRDIPSTISQMHDELRGYKDWGNKIYSFCIPVPSFREGYKYVTIESYYSDENLMRSDLDGRRLFLTSEFMEKSGRHKLDKNLNYSNIGYLKGNTEKLSSKIVDSQVYDEKENNVALSKSDFSDYIINNNQEFCDFCRLEFEKIFYIIEKIHKIE